MNTCEKCEKWSEGEKKNCAYCIANEHKLTGCKKCGSTDFWVNESYTWKCFLEDGIMECKNPNSELDGIFCKECNEKYEDDDIEYNFN